MLDNTAHHIRWNNTDDALQSALAESPDGVMSGLVIGTRVATVHGWQRIEDIAVGDAVLTFDNGLRPVRSIRRVPLWAGDSACPAQFRPLHIPAGVLGNRESMTVLPRQGLMVESDSAERVLGDPFAIIRAEALEGICGVTRIESAAPLEVFVLSFDEDEIVFTAHGALCICAAGGDMVDRLFRSDTGPEYRLLSDDTDAGLINEICCDIIEAVLDSDMEYETAMDGSVHRDMARVA